MTFRSLEIRMRDIGNIYIQQIKRRWLIGCLATLIGGPLMCLCLSLLVTVVFPALDQLSAGGGSNTTLLILAGAGLPIVTLLIFAPLVIMAALTLLRNRGFDAICIPLGLTGSLYMLTGRQYHGQVHGRKVSIYIYRGPTVEIHLESQAQAQVQIVRRGSLSTSVAGFLNKTPLEINDPLLAGLSIYPFDSRGALSLFANQAAVGATTTLMNTGADWAIFRRIEIRPGEVSLYLNRSRHIISNSLDLKSISAWLTALQVLAQAAEMLPAPETPIPVQKNLSPGSRQAMSTFLLYAIIAIVFVMPVCFIGIGVLTFLLVSIP